MKHHRWFVAQGIALAFAQLLLADPVAAVQRAFVSAAIGDDSNTVTACGVAAPCRTFAQAATVVDTGGEVVALAGGLYGGVTLTKSISLTAAPGIFAGITPLGGSRGVTIAAPGVNIVLRGLTISGMGGDAGIYMSGGSRLSVENCVIANFAGGYGIFVDAPATVRVLDTLVRDSSYGIVLRSGADAAITRSLFFDNGYGVHLSNGTVDATSAAISETTISGSTSAGVAAFGTAASGIARANLTRVAVINGTGEGVHADAANGGSASLTLSGSLVSGNATGVRQSGTGLVRSAGTNAIVGNDVEVQGTLNLVESR